ncbi:MAG: nucleotidyltransferase domain-containing protein [Saprospiraceae bacterium]
MDIIKKYQNSLIDICKNFKVDELFVFGSILTDKFKEDSDIDFIVSLASEDPIEYAENYLELKFALSNIFKRKIDLLEQKAIKNKTFEHIINKQKKLVYARSAQGLA